MALSYTVTDDFKVILKSGNKKIDEVGAFDSEEGANYWGQGVIDKYNSPEYADVDYPNDLPEFG
jgi:predicted transcriptional regulator